MKGLLIKDFYNLKQIKNTYLMIIIILMLYCIFTNKVLFAPVIPILILSTTITSTFMMDNKVKLDRLVISGPIERRQIVASKFILILVIISIAVLIGCLFAIPNLVNKSLTIKSLVEIVLFSVNIALCADGILIVFIYIFSNTIEKIELLTIFAYASSVVIILGLGKLIGLLNDYVNMSYIVVAILNTLLVITIFFVAYKISVKVYCRKDFS